MAMTVMHQIAPFTASRCDDPDLAARAEADGYLYLPAALPRPAILDLRRQILDCCAEQNLLDTSRDRVDAIPAADTTLAEGQSPAWTTLYRRIQGLQAFHALSHHPQMIALLRRLCGDAVLVHPRSIARVVWPKTQRYSTPPHQDHFYIGGSEATWTAWIPLGDCPVELGGLAVAPRSHRLGHLPVRRAEGPGGHGVDAEALAWIGGDFHAGDVLLMHSLTVHQGRDNCSDRLRLSVDFRYQAAKDAIDPASLLPHMGWWTWDELTADWPTDAPLRQHLRRSRAQAHTLSAGNRG